MKNNFLTLVAALLIAAAPAYYAFQAQAEETAPTTNQMAAKCAATDSDQMPAECADATTPAAGEKAPMPKQAGNE